MNEALRDLLIERLAADDATLGASVTDLILAACDGPEALGDLLAAGLQLGRGASAAPARPDPPGAYLRSIAVRGFRGIGPLATLEVEPGPGLTLVAGRNGSGKSSFAEALEVLLTGQSLRWHGRSKVWSEGWRNLHDASDTLIRAEFSLEDAKQPLRVERRWAADVAFDAGAATLAGARTGDLAGLGWAGSLAAFRPFLSYNELGSLFEEGPAKLHDALSAILGLGDLLTLEATLKEARSDREVSPRDVKRRLPGLLEELAACDDERARQAHVALSGRKADLDGAELALVGLVEGEHDPEGELGTLRALVSIESPVSDNRLQLVGASLTLAAELEDAVAGTDGERARQTADLLRAALALHRHGGAEACPVCGTVGALDDTWRAATTVELARLDLLAGEAEEARTQARTARAAARQLMPSPPALLARAGDVGLDAGAALAAWTALTEVDETASHRELAAHLDEAAPALAAALAALRERAEGELSIREDRWRPVARTLRRWIDDARAAAAGAAVIPDLKAAEAWVKETAGVIRNARFAPIAEQARANWEQLRQGSSIDVGAITLTGTGNQRRVDLAVTIDGVEGPALGVMSQGELHALALGLFLPRATLPESPFRFVVIDDPVQAMDPAKVDGLARVLDAAARDRQVIVFTHDERLPEAVRRLDMRARIVEVVRGARSEIRLQEVADPIKRYLDDAWALAATDEAERAIAARVVPTLCRLAIEAACARAVRQRRLARGERHAAVEAELRDVQRLYAWVALALFDTTTQTGAVAERIRGRANGRAGQILHRCNHGAHEHDDGDLRELVDGARELARSLALER